MATRKRKATVAAKADGMGAAGLARGETTAIPAKAGAGKRVRVSQADVPAWSLEDAIRVPAAIHESHGLGPVLPFDVAAALGMKPTTGTFRTLTGAALAFGLTSGGPNAGTIEITPLGSRIVAPTEESDDVGARREALLKPRLLREFLTKYDGKGKLPSVQIAQNVLVSLGVAKEATDRVYKIIVESARAARALREIGGDLFVSLQGTPSGIPRPSPVVATDDEDTYELSEGEVDAPRPIIRPGPAGLKPAENRRVFITHGKNKAFIDTLKELLSFGELEPVVAVEHESVSQPVPDKVLNAMRSCGAAFIHVDAEQKLIDSDGNTHVVLNPNVLIEIGAAMALYGRRFILLVREGVQLPSNLQGLYEVRYSGDKLDSEATIRLLKAIKDIKNHPLPTVET